MTVWVQTGKIGDVLSLLPILHHELKTTGQKPTLMIAAEYAGMLDRVDYVEPFIFEGHWQDLKGALLLAKQNFDRVVCPQIYGNDFPIQHRHPSWQYDQWDRAGHLDRWDTLPLVVSRPSNAKEISDKYIKGPTILYADHSQSSPFFHKDEMARLLVDYFGQSHRIIRLSEVRLANPLDLLALFDSADCLVTVESMPLHLSKASRIPVIALVADMPSPWNGSAYSSRFKLHVRYRDFPTRKDEIVWAIKDSLNKINPVKVEAQPTANRHGFNMSVLRHGNELLKTYRYHPENKGWKTRMATDEGDIVFPLHIAENATEDMRLFELYGKPMASMVVAKAVQGWFKCVIDYGELVRNGSGWRMDNPVRIKYPGNDFTTMVKNLVFFESNSKLFCIWGIKDKAQIILQVNGDAIVQEFQSPAPVWNWGEIRGGAIIPYKDKLLRFFHSRTGTQMKDRDFRYHMGALLMENKPPFTVEKVSSRPIMSGNERYVPGCHHWKRNCVLPFGAIKDRNTIKVSIGLNDSSCALVELSEKELHL